MLPLSREDRERLTAYAENVENPFGVRTRIGLIETEHSEQPKKLGTYGVIKGAGSFLGIVVPQEKLGLEAAGYAMEKLVLYATHLGLGTCWLAGTLNREGFTKAMQTGENEWMPAITPVGYPAEKPSFHEQLMRSSMKSAQRKPWKDLFFREDFHTPLTEADAGVYAEGLELLRLAPSATNSQPWRVVMDNRTFHFYAVVGKEAHKRTGGLQVALGVFVDEDVNHAICGHVIALQNRRHPSRVDIALADEEPLR